MCALHSDPSPAATPRRTARTIKAACLGLAILLVGPLVAAERPNILLVLTDDLGFSDLGCYGGEIPTPNLDRLAAGGLRYSSCYTSARCCPSRASLLSGLHPHQAGVAEMTANQPARGPAYLGRLNDESMTLAERLKAAGYSTWMVGKWHLGAPGPIGRGFDEYFGYQSLTAHSLDQWNPKLYTRLPAERVAELGSGGAGGKAEFYATTAFNDYALEFIRQAREKKGQPWFVYLAHSSPHFPIQAPQADIDRHMPTYRKGWDVLREERLERQKKLGLFPADTLLPPRELVPRDSAAIANGYAGEPNPAWESLDADRREDLARRMATYAAMVEHVDAGIGKILADLEKNNEMDNTLIVFLSDNGACYEWGPFGFDGESRKGLNTLRSGAELQQTGQSGTHSSYGSAWANLGNTPLKLYKHFCHEGGLRSPLVVHFPASIKPAGAWVNDPVHLMDIVPTLTALAGASNPTEFMGKALIPLEGVSLVPTFAGGALAPRTLAFEHERARGLRRGEWKIAWGKRIAAKPAWELYNLVADPTEQKDLAKEMPELTAELAEEWMAWAKRVNVDLK